MRERLAALVKQVCVAGDRRQGLDADLRRRLDDVLAVLRDEHAEPGPSQADPLTGLVDVFGLDQQDAELLTIAVAPDLDANLALAFGLLRGGAAPARATVGLALELASLPTLSGAGPTYLGPTAPTRRHGLLEVASAPALWLGREAWVPDRVLAHLLGVDDPDPLLTPAPVEPVPVERLDVDGLLAAAVEAGEPLV